MQEFILIPEVPMIVRKIAPDGRHCAYWDASNDSAESSCRDWCHRLQQGRGSEGRLIWTTKSHHTPSQTVFVTFKEQTDVR